MLKVNKVPAMKYDWRNRRRESSVNVTATFLVALFIATAMAPLPTLNGAITVTYACES